MTLIRSIQFTTVVLVLVGTLAACEPSPMISPAKSDANAFLVHSIKSPYQAGTTTIRVLLPDRLDTGKKYRVMFVFPVEAKDGTGT